jgi:hypothetical protein
MTLSILLALACSAVAWLLHGLRRLTLALGLGVGIVLMAFGVFLSVAYPWSNIPVLLVALAGGMLLGRGIAARPASLLLLLSILSALDIVQVFLTSGTPPPGQGAGGSRTWLLYGNFTLWLASGKFNLGLVDLLLVVAMTEHWLRRGGSIPISFSPGPIGFVLADLFVLATMLLNLPLIPFLTVGWLCSEGWYHFVSKRVSSTRSFKPYRLRGLMVR